MKKGTGIAIFLGLLIVGGAFGVWQSNNRKIQRAWPYKQLQNAVTLGAAQQHGSYPSRLEDLVSNGTLDQDVFSALRFQASYNADPEPWLYKAPRQPSDIAIVAPRRIYAWTGHSGYTATASADGSGKLILVAKRSLIPAWATKTKKANKTEMATPRKPSD